MATRLHMPFRSEDGRFLLRKVQDAAVLAVWWRCPTCGATNTPGKIIHVYSVAMTGSPHRATLLFCCDQCEARWTHDPARGGLPPSIRTLLQPDRKWDTEP